jgi:hypothetical protein
MDLSRATYIHYYYENMYTLDSDFEHMLKISQVCKKFNVCSKRALAHIKTLHLSDENIPEDIRNSNVKMTANSFRPWFGSTFPNDTQINVLDLTNCCALVRIDSNFFNLQQLQYLKQLYLINCQNLKRIPKNLASCALLEVLDISKSSIEVIPANLIKNCYNLKHFIAEETETLQYISPEILGLTKLEGLSLSCINAENMRFGHTFHYRNADELGKLTNLKCLKLINVGLHSSHILQITKNLPNLTVLELSMRTDFFEEYDIENMTNLTSLAFECNYLQKLPSYFTKLTNITDLSIRNWMTSATGIQQDFLCLPHLVSLVLHGCGDLIPPPVSFTDLVSLELLAMSENRYIQQYVNLLPSLTNLVDLHIPYLAQNLHLSSNPNLLTLHILKKQRVSVDTTGCMNLQFLEIIDDSDDDDSDDGEESDVDDYDYAEESDVAGVSDGNED